MTQASPADAGTRVQVRSRFASADVDPADVLIFPDGLPGYESAREFVLLDVPDQAPLKVLHAVSAPEPCFLVVDPTVVLPTYRCELAAADRLRLGARDDSALVWLALVMVGTDGAVAVNLRAPIVINPARMIARQVMPSACLYPLRHVLGDPVDAWR